MKLKAVLKRGKPSRSTLGFLLAGAGLVSLYFYHLSSLTGKLLSSGELEVANTPIGWHGLYHQPMFAALALVRSAFFFVQPDFGTFLLRSSNVIFGLLACIAFYFVVRSWHGAKIALLASLLFACSAYGLHVSRLASNDVMYLMAVPLLFLGYILPRKYPGSKLPLIFNTLVWLTLLFVPGMVWLVLASLYTQQQTFGKSLKALSIIWKLIYSIFVLAPISLLGYLLYLNGGLMNWIGLPSHFEAPLLLLKQFVAVPVHLFLRGPQYPDLWLGKAPVLDIFCLSMFIIGVYFYVTNATATRSKAMFLYGTVGVILVAIGGAVSLALLVPLLYLLIATGLTYMRQQWLQVFPGNPIARSLGVSLIVVAVALSCVYNLRAYFVAWPHNSATHETFTHRIKNS